MVVNHGQIGHIWEKNRVKLRIGSDLKKAYETAAWGTLLDFMEICRISCFFGKRDVSR